MRIVRDIGQVKRRKRIGKWSAFLGFLMLASTFLFIFMPINLAVAYGLLIVGFVTFNYGMQQIGKWGHTERSPRNDLSMDARLSALGDRYAMLHYMRVGKKMVEHMLLFPGGVLVLTARDVPGRIVGKGSNWRRKGLGFLRLFGMSGPQLGNPSLETDQSINRVEQVLRENEFEVDLYGGIIFTSPLVDLETTDTDYPAMTIDQLPDFVSQLDVDPTFKTADLDRLIEILGKGEEIERTERTSSRRPVKVKRRAAVKS
jgi:hypothetical protein